MKKKYSESEKAAIFDQAFLPHIQTLYNFAFHLTLNEDDAKDLLQDTYLKAYRFINSYEDGTNARAWLFRILKNNFINVYRKKSKQPKRVDYSDIENYYNAGDAAQLTGNLSAEIINKLVGDEVSIALNSLGFDYKMVIMLCDVEGFSYEEIAKILEIPIGTVRSRLHRARHLLKEKLKEYAKSLGYD